MIQAQETGGATRPGEATPLAVSSVRRGQKQSASCHTRSRPTGHREDLAPDLISDLTLSLRAVRLRARKGKRGRRGESSFWHRKKTSRFNAPARSRANPEPPSKCRRILAASCLLLRPDIKNMPAVRVLNATRRREHSLMSLTSRVTMTVVHLSVTGTGRVASTAVRCGQPRCFTTAVRVLRSPPHPLTIIPHRVRTP